MFKSILSKFLFVVIALAIFFVAFSKLPKTKPNLGIEPQKQVTIGNTTIPVELADSVVKLEKGLSDRSFLAEKAGMLFVFTTKTQAVFWMKDMKIPLDMIWISDNQVVGIEKNVPLPPVSGTLPTYMAPEPVNYVLEVNANFAERHNIQKGTKFTLSSLPKN